MDKQTDGIMIFSGLKISEFEKNQKFYFTCALADAS